MLTQVITLCLLLLFMIARVGTLADNSDENLELRRRLVEDEGLFNYGLKYAGRRLANQPNQGFFCDVQYASPTLAPTKDFPTAAPAVQPTPKTPGPTNPPSPGDDDNVYLCDTTDKGLLYFTFLIYVVFWSVWLYRLCAATQVFPLPAGEEIPDEEKVMWKVSLTYCTPKYVWNVASQVGHALPAKPGMDQRTIGGFANISTTSMSRLPFGGNFETITFNASKSAIDALNDGIYKLSAKSGPDGLFTKYEHEVACAMMHPGEGGPLAVRMLNQKHAPEHEVMFGGLYAKEKAN